MIGIIADRIVYSSVPSLTGTQSIKYKIHGDEEQIHQHGLTLATDRKKSIFLMLMNDERILRRTGSYYQFK